MKASYLIALAIVLILTLCACGAPTPAGTSAAPSISSSPSAGQTAKTAVTAIDATGTPAVAAPTAAPGSAGMGAFIDAFQTVQQNPLGEDMSYALYLEAMNPEPVQTAAPSASAMAALLEKLQALVDSTGVHYVDSATVMGMDVKTEHWMKGNKFKTIDALTGDIVVFDGTTGIRYNPETKTGTKMEDIDITANRNLQAVGLLTLLTVSPYENKPDEKFGQWDCAVFYMNIEFMGMKGNTVYIDKATGLIVKNAYGDPKVDKSSMVTTVQSMDIAGISADVFIVPADIVIE